MRGLNSISAFIAALVLATDVSAQKSVIIERPVVVDEQDVLSPFPMGFEDIAPHDQLILEDVVLKSDASLILPPFSSVVIKRLVSADGARIQIAHSASGQDAEPGVSGGHGARVRFFVKELRGHIVLESRGGRGGDGWDGRHGRQGLDGEPGRDARTLFGGWIYLGDGEAGRTGYPGEDGEDGQRGGDGGDGGRVSLYFSESDLDAKILVDVAGGDAGLGGRAGVGGLGGNGGPGGEGNKPGIQGPMGKRGKSGKPGQPGNPGKPGSSGIYQVSSEMFECLLRLDVMHREDVLMEDDFASCEALDFGSKLVSQNLWASDSFNPRSIKPEDASVWIQADGRNGKSSSRSRQYGESPPDASNGSGGGRITVFLLRIPAQLFMSARGGAGGNGADGALGRRGRDGMPGRDAQPFRPARPGGDGEDGSKGGDGSHGGSGGDGGSIRIVLLDPGESLQLESVMKSWALNVSAGLGGAPGNGGTGGRGGIGGKGGKAAPPKNRAADGKNGKDGDQGARGQGGHVGEKGDIEVITVNSMATFIVDEFRRDLY